MQKQAKEPLSRRMQINVEDESSQGLRAWSFNKGRRGGKREVPILSGI